MVWGIDVAAGRVAMLSPEGADLVPPPGVFRWLHVSLADQRGRRLLGGLPIAASARELLLSPDGHQRALVVEDMVACVVHDFAREFTVVTGAPASTAALHFALAPWLMVTARHHPVRCADLIRQHIERGLAPTDASAALDLLMGALLEVSAGGAAELTGDIQAIEDALLGHGREPEAHQLPSIRRRAVLAQRQLAGLHRVFNRLEQDDDLPEPLAPAVSRIVQRITSLEADVAAVQGQTRLLRDEIDLHTAQRTNQNLYVLSVMTALMLPATLVTGIFGMNTGGMPLVGSSSGTGIACVVAVATSAATYVALRLLGFLGGSRG